MWDPEVAPYPAGGKLENTIIDMKKEDAMQIFYDDELNHLDPFANLSAGLEGKYLCYGGGVKPLQSGKSFAEGFIMRLADRPDSPENTIISVEPCLNKDGTPQLEMTIYQANCNEQRAQANEPALKWAGRPEVYELEKAVSC